MNNTTTEEIQDIEMILETLDISKHRKNAIKIQECFKNVYSIIDSAKPALKKIQIEGKDVHKTLFQEIKLLERASIQSQKKIKRSSSRVTGFTKPIRLLPAVAAFFGCGDELSRSSITKLVNTYVKNNNLQIPEKQQTFILDRNLAMYFNGNVNDVDSYSLFTRRIKFAFPIEPKVPAIQSLNSLADVANDVEAVVVFSYSKQFLNKALHSTDAYNAERENPPPVPKYGSLAHAQIMLNRNLSVFCDAAASFAVPKRVMFFVIDDSDNHFVFVQTRIRSPSTVPVDQFSREWLVRELDGYINPTN